MRCDHTVPFSIFHFCLKKKENEFKFYFVAFFYAYKIYNEVLVTII